MSKPLYRVGLAGKVLTGVIILLYAIVLFSLKPSPSGNPGPVGISFIALLFAGVSAVFLAIFLKMKNPWWAGIPFVLCLALECLFLLIVLFSIHTDPAFSPFFEILPLIYWFLSGAGLMISSVIAACHAFAEGWKSGRYGTGTVPSK